MLILSIAKYHNSDFKQSLKFKLNNKKYRGIPVIYIKSYNMVKPRYLLLYGCVNNHIRIRAIESKMNAMHGNIITLENEYTV